MVRGKMKDWQLPPKWISKNLPICPICKTRTSWEVFQKIGMISLSKYQFICSNCKAMWEIPCVGIDSVAVMTGLTGLFIRGAKSDVKELKLVEAGTHPKGESYLNKSGELDLWREMLSYCSQCGSPLADDEKHCPNCGSERN